MRRTRILTLRRLRRRWVLTEAVPLGAIVAVAAAAASAFALSLVQYVIMPDEVAYVKQGIELSHGDFVGPGDFWFNSWALLRPLTIAPFYRWLDTPTAFDATHVAGAVLMASTAVPAFLLARRLVACRPAALLVAALTVAVPWIAMAGTMMTEVVAYPAFTWAVLAMVRAIERPSARRDLLVAAALGLVFFARTQLVILAPAFGAAVALEAVVRRDGHRRASRRVLAAGRTHWVLLGGLVVGVLGVVATGSTRRFLGGYAEPTRGALIPDGTLHATHELLAYVVVGVGIVPLAFTLAWIALTVAGRRSGPSLAAACVFVCVGALLLAVGGVFTVRFTAGINDRYLFYIAPLLFAGTAAATANPAVRGWRVAVVASCALVTWSIWTADLAQHGPSLVSPTMAFHDVLSARGSDVGLSGPHLAAAAALVLTAAAVLIAPRIRRGALSAGLLGAVLIVCASQTIYTFDKVGATQAGVSDEFLLGRDWVDRAVPRGARVGLVTASVGDARTTTATWWDTSFWNKTIDRIYRAPESSAYDQGAVETIVVDPDTGRVPNIDGEDLFVRTSADARFGLHGSRTVGTRGGVLILRAERPYRLDWLMASEDPDDSVIAPGARARVRGWGPAGTNGLSVTVFAPEDAPRAVPFEITAGGKTSRGAAPSGKAATLRIQAPLARGFADIDIHVSRGASAPLRLVGVQPS